MILVIGGSGLVGGEILRLLSKAGITASGLVRNLQKAPRLPGVNWVEGDLAKPETLLKAFVGIKKLFLLSAISDDTVALQHNGIVAARTCGVEHIIKLSAFGATDHSKAPICKWHYEIEEEMQNSGMGWTILRPHHFMQNLLAQTEYIINEGAVYSASGDGKIPYVDARDIAAVAAVTLSKPGHVGKTYVVTGSEALSYRQA
ncbi:MAG TPA: NAD(P)H-binding protein, partial [Chlamydiales bacterium]|nr:NAD(P)H-binding protein [Chlamydiales bacterium]